MPDIADPKVVGVGLAEVAPDASDDGSSIGGFIIWFLQRRVTHEGGVEVNLPAWYGPDHLECGLVYFHEVMSPRQV